jgi:hypothetical protein
MSRRSSWALRLVALVGIAGGLSGCAVYPVGYGYRSPGYGYGYGAPAYRPYYGRGYYGGGGGYYGGGGYGRGYGGRGW